jgi:mannitol/fructose-specific phosphotransferase system IIA component (Ntr-type)
MICAKDERTHLHVLARLVRMLDDHDVVAQMIHAGSADRLREVLEDRERAILTATA